ncbi:redox-sensitive transcriptional activator soxR [Mycobacterium xenopi 4042]|uniref:Redox-sensitive transcriptional activator soxR n=1 Tax=Mycobacterium xenopi 4042 TaxID=1299334 RepID=X8BKA9_MYCXE|nr:redox-sensitive transcriptional activator soxR [Mycobacterium xenopi 4042]
MESRDLLTVGEIARRSGFAASAIRFYENVGLITASRTSGGQRRFERNMLRRLAFIRAARNVGLSLEEVAAALAKLPDGRTPTRPTGIGCPGIGGPASTTRLRDWSRFATTWTRASVAVVCR